DLRTLGRCRRGGITPHPGSPVHGYRGGPADICAWVYAARHAMFAWSGSSRDQLQFRFYVRYAPNCTPTSTGSGTRCIPHFSATPSRTTVAICTRSRVLTVQRYDKANVMVVYRLARPLTVLDSPLSPKPLL